MKHIQESIIGRKGTLGRFFKNMLKPGYVIRYRDGDLGMYLDYEDIKKAFQRNPIYIELANGSGGFYSKSSKFNDIDWMSIDDYDDNLWYTFKGSGSFKSQEHSCDIINVYCIKAQPQLLNQESLEKLIKSIDPTPIKNN